jgi:hypothetical protein
MPDLLAHAFVAYALASVLSWRYEWLGPPYVTVMMVGAFVPDLRKVGLFVDQRVVESLLGVPFSWDPLHYFGGVLVSTVLGGFVLAPAGQARRRTLALLSLGATSHLLLDGLIRTPTGRSYPVFWPLTEFQPPTPGLYLSTEPWPTLAAGAVALVVWYLTRRQNRRDATTGES